MGDCGDTSWGYILRSWLRSRCGVALKPRPPTRTETQTPGTPCRHQAAPQGLPSRVSLHPPRPTHHHGLGSGHAPKPLDAPVRNFRAAARTPNCRCARHLRGPNGEPMRSPQPSRLGPASAFHMLRADRRRRHGGRCPRTHRSRPCIRRMRPCTANVGPGGIFTLPASLTGTPARSCPSPRTPACRSQCRSWRAGWRGGAALPDRRGARVLTARPMALLHPPPGHSRRRCRTQSHEACQPGWRTRPVIGSACSHESRCGCASRSERQPQ